MNDIEQANATVSEARSLVEQRQAKLCGKEREVRASLTLQ
jgi:hypothetical protein